MSRRFVMRNRIGVCLLLFSCLLGTSLAQDRDVQKANWLLDVKFKLEGLKQTALDDIRKYEAEIQKCQATIDKCENVISLARQQNNARAEGIAQEAMTKAQAARAKNTDLKKGAELNKKRAEIALAYVNSDGKDLEAKLEQIDLEYATAEWKENQRKLIEERLRAPNPQAAAILRTLAGHSSPLTRNAPPPLPPTTFDQLKSGDVLLIDRDIIGSAINVTDRLLSGSNASRASHTVIYLKEVNGQKLFLENIPNEGPRIISEKTFLERYSERGGKVAQLAEPLNPEEAKQLWDASVATAAKNNRTEAKRWLGVSWLDTKYGVWGEDNLVCSEVDRAVLRAAGRDIPESDDRIKKYLGVKFSPADFYDSGRFFVVGPLTMPAGPAERLP
jgi:hypothetical protein